MLVLSRKKGESIMIGDQIELVILQTEGDSVRVGIIAPRNVQIHRKEVYLSIQQENREASNSIISVDGVLKIAKKEDK